VNFVLLAGFNALALICMYLYFKARIEKQLESERLLDKLHTEAGLIVGEMIQDLNRITDRNIALMETKVEELRMVLETAEKRIVLMQRQTHKEEEAGKLYGRLQKKENEYAQAAARFPLREMERHGQTRKSAKLLPEKTQAALQTDEKQAVTTEEILDLYRTGISAELISKRLNLPAGEVQLIISLRDHKGKKRE